MPLILNQDTKPKNLISRTSIIYSEILLGDYEIGMKDFTEMVMYVMTNTDLSGSADPRVKLRERIKSLQITEGFNCNIKRFSEPIQMVNTLIEKIVRYEQETGKKPTVIYLGGKEWETLKREIALDAGEDIKENIFHGVKIYKVMEKSHLRVE